MCVRWVYSVKQRAKEVSLCSFFLAKTNPLQDNKVQPEGCLFRKTQRYLRAFWLKWDQRQSQQKSALTGHFMRFALMLACLLAHLMSVVTNQSAHSDL